MSEINVRYNDYYGVDLYVDGTRVRFEAQAAANFAAVLDYVAQRAPTDPFTFPLVTGGKSLGTATKAQARRIAKELRLKAVVQAQVGRRP